MNESESRFTTEPFAEKYLKTSAVYRITIDGFFAAIARAIKRAPDIHSAIEIGCGSGFSTARLRRMLMDRPFSASDYFDNMVEEAARRNPGVSITRESAYELSYSSKSADLVIMLEVLEHLEDPERALCEISRVSGKYILVSVPREPLWCALNMVRGAYWQSWGNTPGHINHWSMRAFVQFVGRVADVITVCTPIPWTIVLARVRPKKP